LTKVTQPFHKLNFIFFVLTLVHLNVVLSSSYLIRFCKHIWWRLMILFNTFFYYSFWRGESNTKQNQSTYVKYCIIKIKNCVKFMRFMQICYKQQGILFGEIMKLSYDLFLSPLLLKYNFSNANFLGEI
jgi:hypothetical protein